MSNLSTKQIEEPGWSFLRSPRWLGYYALIIVFSIACVFLGNWQFDRREQARAEIDRIDTNYDAQAIGIEEALPTLDHFDLDKNKWHPVKVRGAYVGEPFLARNRVSASGVGSLLVHPLQLENGQIFFVDRGWVPVNVTAGIPDALPMPAQGQVEVTARLRQSEALISNRETLGSTVGSINLPELESLVGQSAYTGSYGQLVSESPQGETGELAPKPERDEGPHLSYALQWYVFILIVLGGAGYAASLEWKSLNTTAARKKRASKDLLNRNQKKLTDAEEEDAYLDAES